jgi:hypothetical protein
MHKKQKLTAYPAKCPVGQIVRGSDMTAAVAQLLYKLQFLAMATAKDRDLEICSG